MTPLLPLYDPPGGGSGVCDPQVKNRWSGAYIEWCKNNNHNNNKKKTSSNSSSSGSNTLLLRWDRLEKTASSWQELNSMIEMIVTQITTLSIHSEQKGISEHTKCKTMKQLGYNSRRTHQGPHLSAEIWVYRGYRLTEFIQSKSCTGIHIVGERINILHFSW